MPTFLGSRPTRSTSRSRTASSRCPASTRRTAATPDGGSYVRRERRFGAFSRSIALPAGVDAQAIKAQTHDGVVEVTVPLPSGATTQKVENNLPAPASEEG